MVAEECGPEKKSESEVGQMSGVSTTVPRPEQVLFDRRDREAPRLLRRVCGVRPGPHMPFPNASVEGEKTDK